MPIRLAARRRLGGHPISKEALGRRQAQGKMGQRLQPQAIRQGDPPPQRAPQDPPKRSGIRAGGHAALRGSDARMSSAAFTAREGRRVAARLKGDELAGGKRRIPGQSVRSEVSSAPKGGHVLTGAEKRTRLQAALRLALSRARLRKYQVFLDLYGGTGGVTASLRRAGFAVITFD